MSASPSLTQVLPGFDRAAWHELTVRSLLHSADWLEIMSSRMPGEVHTVVHAGQVGFLGAVIDDAGVYEAFNPHAILFRDPPVFDVGASEGGQLRLPEADPAALLPSLVLAGPGYLGDPAGTYPAGTDGAGTDRAGGDPVGACLSGVLDWCRRRGVKTVCCLYTHQATAVVARAVAALGGDSFPLTARWSLPVWWDSWDSYLAGFSASRRRKIRRELRAAAAAGVRPARLDPLEHVEAIVDGRCARLRGYGHQPDRAAERRRLERLLETFTGRAEAYGAVRGRELVGSVVCVEHERTAHVLYSGTTDEGSRLPFTHFVASYYALAQQAGRRGLDRVDYGIDHGAAKAFRGCRPELLHGHAVGLDPAASALLGAAAGALRDAWSGQPAGNETMGRQPARRTEWQTAPPADRQPPRQASSEAPA